MRIGTQQQYNNQDRYVNELFHLKHGLYHVKSGVYKSYKFSYIYKSGEPGLVDRVLALHAGSRGFDSHRGHMSERFFRSNRPGYPHPVSSELEK